MPAATKGDLDEKWEQINQQPGVLLGDQNRIVNSERTLQLEIERIPRGVRFSYLNGGNQPIVEPEVRWGLVDIEFGYSNGHTTITFVFFNKGWWSGLRLHTQSLRFHSRGPFPSRVALMAAFGRAHSRKKNSGRGL